MSIVRILAGMVFLATILPGSRDRVLSPLFEAVSSISFHHSARPTDRKHLPETMGSGVAVMDVDNDGRLDVFFVNGGDASNRLYRNLGGWRFQDVTEAWGVRGSGYGMGVAAGDYDNDGKTDIFVTSVGRNYLYRNNGSRFAEVAGPSGVAGAGWSVGAAFVDYDRDGRLDLFVSRYLDWDLDKSKWCGDGEGAPRSYCHPREFGKVSHLLYRNLRNGTFEDVTDRTGISRKPGKGLGVKIEDVNQDGWPDILVANDSVAQQLFLNRAGDRFDEVALASGLAYDEDGSAYAGMGIDAADVDGDNQPDVFINALARQGYWLYKAWGNGRFQAASAASGLTRITDMRSGWGARLTDFDNDGWPDLAVAQGHVMDTIEWSDPGVKYLEPPLLAKNLFGKFFDVSAQAGPAFAQPRAGRGLATGDFDNDGRIDLVINNNNSAATVLRNVTAPGNNWIQIRLEGVKSNRDGYGSQVMITTDSDRRIRVYSDTSGSYLSASSPILHVGLGPEGQARKIEVTWPSGAVTSWKGAAANRVLRLREPGSRR